MWSAIEGPEELGQGCQVVQAPLTSSKSHDSADLGRPVALQPSPALGSTPATRSSPRTGQPSPPPCWVPRPWKHRCLSPSLDPIIYPHLRLCSCPKSGHRVVIF